MNRRTFITGSTLAALLSGNTSAAARRSASPIKHFVFVNLVGAPSQFETFDPKPGSPNNGPTKAVKTRIPGVSFADSMENLAGLADNMAVIRMTSKEGNHERAQYLLQSGGYLPVGVLKHASLTSIAGWGMENPSTVIPPAIGIGKGTRSSGYLGKYFNPYIVERASNGATNIIPHSRYRNNINRGRKLLNLYTTGISPKSTEDEFLEEKKLQIRAARLSDDKAAEAFNVKTETLAVRSRYGADEIGSSCLLAKRLIETGVASIQINYGNWDTHQDNFTKTAQLAKPLDKALAALINDLKSNGKYNETLILVAGEFGRTPRINPNQGRDHYARSWTAVLAGGTLKGQEIGSTDDNGTAVAGGITIPELSFCMYKMMGINPNKWTNTDTGRPIKMSPGKEGIAVLNG